MNSKKKKKICLKFRHILLHYIIYKVIFSVRFGMHLDILGIINCYYYETMETIYNFQLKKKNQNNKQGCYLYNNNNVCNISSFVQHNIQYILKHIGSTLVFLQYVRYFSSL